MAGRGAQGPRLHTIVLMQTGNASTRTWTDYETVRDAMDGVCQIFEKRLKDLNPQLRDITYDISDLYNFIDGLPDLSALVFAPETGMYSPKNKDWVKSQVFAHLKRQAAR